MYWPYVCYAGCCGNRYGFFENLSHEWMREDLPTSPSFYVKPSEGHSKSKAVGAIDQSTKKETQQEDSPLFSPDSIESEETMPTMLPKEIDEILGSLGESESRE